jgi:hypothetical protein
MDNEFNKAMEAVLDHGMQVIDNLTPDQLQQVMEILNGAQND